LKNLGLEQVNSAFFDTILVKADAKKVKAVAEANEVNFYYADDNTLSISLNETTSVSDVNDIINIFATALSLKATTVSELTETNHYPENLNRTSAFVEHDVFNKYHSEPALMRYHQNVGA